MSPGRFEGRACAVTGGGTGIGYAVARRLAAEGCAVLVVDRDADRAEAAGADIADAGGDAAVATLDLGDRSARREVVPAVLDHFGRLDLLVNNAAYHGPRVRFLDLPEDEWDLVLETNLTAAAGLVRSAAPHMLERGAGAVVNVSAIQEALPLATYVAYGASKGGVNALTRALAAELSPDGIRVNAVAPGVIETTSLQNTLAAADGAAEAAGDDLEANLEHTPVPALLGRKGVPSEVAAAVAFLGSEDASFVTGTVLRVDGGRSISRLPDPFEAHFRTRPRQGRD